MFQNDFGRRSLAGTELGRIELFVLGTNCRLKVTDSPIYLYRFCRVPKNAAKPYQITDCGIGGFEWRLPTEHSICLPVNLRQGATRMCLFVGFLTNVRQRVMHTLFSAFFFLVLLLKKFFGSFALDCHSTKRLLRSRRLHMAKKFSGREADYRSRSNFQINFHSILASDASSSQLANHKSWPTDLREPYSQTVTESGSRLVLLRQEYFTDRKRTRILLNL